MGVLRTQTYRSRSEIEAARRRARKNQDDCASLAEELRAERDYVGARTPEVVAKRLEGYLAAFSWLLGETGASPITGRPYPSSGDPAYVHKMLFKEEAPGRDMAESGNPGPNDLGRAFTEGFGEAISWYKGAYDDGLPSLF